MICDAETLELAQAIERDPRRPAREDLPRRGQAGADAVGARGRDRALPGRRRGRPTSSPSCAAACARSPPQTGSRSAPPAPTPSARYEDQLIVDRPALPGAGGGAPLDREARADLRHPRPRRHRRRREGDLRRRRHARLPAAAAGDVQQLAALARARPTGMMSSRTPVFRAFPRVGIPPYYGTWEIYSHRVEQMMRGGAIDDYTYLWWDVRPHPNLGTVELRVFDQQTRVEHTIGFAALAQCARAPARGPLRRRRAQRRAPLGADRRQQGARGARRDRGRS